MAYSRREQFVSDALSADVEACIVWPFAVRKSSGYGAHSYSCAGHKINVDVHRYVCGKAHGLPEYAHMQAAHRCGNKLCINQRHLYWATPAENMADAISHGTLRGGGRYRQRFFEPQIADICTSTDSLVVLAAKYGTQPSYVGRIRQIHSHGYA